MSTTGASVSLNRRRGQSGRHTRVIGGNGDAQGCPCGSPDPGPVPPLCLDHTHEPAFFYPKQSHMLNPDSQPLTGSLPLKGPKLH